MSWQHRKASAVLFCILTILFAAATPHTVNCRKFVFAPVCRGVAAKRSDPIVTSETRPEFISNIQSKADDEDGGEDSITVSPLDLRALFRVAGSSFRGQLKQPYWFIAAYKPEQAEPAYDYI